MLLFYVMAMIGGVLSTMIAILLISFLLDWAGSIFVNQKDGDKLRLILPVTLIPVIIANTIRIFGVTEFLVWMIALLSLYSSVLQIMAIRILKGLNIVKSIIVVVIALSIAISPWLIISYFLKIKNNPQPATITSEIISSQKHYQLWTYSV